MTTDPNPVYIAPGIEIDKLVLEAAIATVIVRNKVHADLLQNPQKTLLEVGEVYGQLRKARNDG